MNNSKVNVIIFDIGNVLIKCGASYLFTNWMGLSEKFTKKIINTAIHPDWVAELDSGKTFDKAVKERISLYPQYEKYINAYSEHWEETLVSVENETINIISELLSNNYKLYALSNWPSEKYYLLEKNLPILKDFNGVVISGNIGLIKPNEEIFSYTLNKYKINKNECLFIDDLLVNINASTEFGIKSYQYVSPDSLGSYLKTIGVL